MNFLDEMAPLREELIQLQEAEADIRQQQAELLMDFLYRVADALRGADDVFSSSSFDRQCCANMLRDVENVLDVLESADLRDVGVQAFQAFESSVNDGVVLIMMTYEGGTDRLDLQIDILRQLGIE